MPVSRNQNDLIVTNYDSMISINVDQPNLVHILDKIIQFMNTVERDMTDGHYLFDVYNNIFKNIIADKTSHVNTVYHIHNELTNNSEIEYILSKFTDTCVSTNSNIFINNIKNAHSILIKISLRAKLLIPLIERFNIPSSYIKMILCIDDDDHIVMDALEKYMYDLSSSIFEDNQKIVHRKKINVNLVSRKFFDDVLLKKILVEVDLNKDFGNFIERSLTMYIRYVVLGRQTLND